MEDFPEESEYVSPPGAMVEVPGPNPFPTGSRIETSTENYAAGGPPTITVSSAVKKARAAIVAREMQQADGEVLGLAKLGTLTEMVGGQAASEVNDRIASAEAESAQATQSDRLIT